MIDVSERFCVDEKKESTLPRRYHEREEKIVFKDMPSSNPLVEEIKRAGERYGLVLEVLYAFQLDKIIIFASNGEGHRWQFMDVENVDGSYRSLDGRTVIAVKEILHYNRSSRERARFFKDLRKRREEAKAKGMKDVYEQLGYIGAQHKRTFQALSRILGYTSGKTNIPFGYQVNRRHW